jgi:hypothetical protein
LYIVLLDRLAGATPPYQLGFRDQHSCAQQDIERAAAQFHRFAVNNGWPWRRRTSKHGSTVFPAAPWAHRKLQSVSLRMLIWLQRLTGIALRSLRWNLERFRSVKGLLKAAACKISQQAELELVA